MPCFHFSTPLCLFLLVSHLPFPPKFALCVLPNSEVSFRVTSLMSTPSALVYGSPTPLTYSRLQVQYKWLAAHQAWAKLRAHLRLMIPTCHWPPEPAA